jgi:uncharacterized integral membrane protein
VTDDDAAFEKEPDLIPATRQARSGSGFSWGLAVFLLAAIVFVVFVVQNMSDVLVKLFSWEFTLPLPLLLVVTALVSVVADEILGLMRRRRRRRRLAEKEELTRYRRT